LKEMKRDPKCYEYIRVCVCVCFDVLDDFTYRIEDDTCNDMDHNLICCIHIM